MKIGVLGYADHSGLGRMTADLIRHLGAERHLAPDNGGKTALWPAPLAAETTYSTLWTPPHTVVDQFLAGLDAVVTVETDYGTHLADRAREESGRHHHLTITQSRKTT